MEEDVDGKLGGLAGYDRDKDGDVEDGKCELDR